MSKLVLGPVLFNWDADRLRDFYESVAREPCIDTVCLGEVICAKRPKHRFDDWQEIIETLLSHHKKVRYSSLGVISNAYEVKMLKQACQSHWNDHPDFCIEANDMTALPLLKPGAPFTVGQLFNCYNEASLQFLARQGATSVTLPVELSLQQLRSLAAVSNADLGVQVFGRMPLALSVRCYQARAYGLQKQNCNIICENDLDGLPVDTLDREPVFAVNGLQTLSYAYCNLIREITHLQAAGIREFRISPQLDVDTLSVCRLFAGVMEGSTTVEVAGPTLDELLRVQRQSNGYLYGKPGMERIPVASL
ncbi:MAG: U32 family peptidase [Ketobacteraceae bacterium]|nr:U32 family peptidase [Ketobacteraceae bacterium]